MACKFSMQVGYVTVKFVFVLYRSIQYAYQVQSAKHRQLKCLVQLGAACTVNFDLGHVQLMWCCAMQGSCAEAI